MIIRDNIVWKSVVGAEDRYEGIITHILDSNGSTKTNILGHNERPPKR